MREFTVGVDDDKTVGGGRYALRYSTFGSFFRRRQLVWGWLNWVNATVPIPLALLGFGLAIWQAFEAQRAAGRAQSAAEAAQAAAQEAASTTRARFREISVSSLSSQLMLIERAIDTAVVKKQGDLLSHVMVNWHWQAGMCREYLDESRPEEKDVMTKIQTSIVAVNVLKQKVIAFNGQTDWLKETMRVRRAIGAVTSQLGEIAAHQSVKESS